MLSSSSSYTYYRHHHHHYHIITIPIIIIINTIIIIIIALIGILSSRDLAGWIHSEQRQGHYPREAQREEGWTSERGEWV
jgi:hypothetical protein